jgi:hypothetical protein
MENEGSSPGLQEPAFCPYPEPVHATPSHFLKIHLANSLATAVSEPDLYMLLTSHVPNVKFLFHYLGRTKRSVGPVEHVWHMYAFRKKASY